MEKESYCDTPRLPSEPSPVPHPPTNLPVSPTSFQSSDGPVQWSQSTGPERRRCVQVHELQSWVSPQTDIDRRLLYELVRKDDKFPQEYCRAAAGWVVHPGCLFNLGVRHELQQHLWREFPCDWKVPLKEAFTKSLQSARFEKQQLDIPRATQAEVDRIRREVQADLAAKDTGAPSNPSARHI